MAQIKPKIAIWAACGLTHAWNFRAFPDQNETQGTILNDRFKSGGCDDQFGTRRGVSDRVKPRKEVWLTLKCSRDVSRKPIEFVLFRILTGVTPFQVVANLEENNSDCELKRKMKRRSDDEPRNLASRLQKSNSLKSLLGSKWRRRQASSISQQSELPPPPLSFPYSLSPLFLVHISRFSELHNFSRLVLWFYCLSPALHSYFGY